MPLGLRQDYDQAYDCLAPLRCISPYTPNNKRGHYGKLASICAHDSCCVRTRCKHSEQLGRAPTHYLVAPWVSICCTGKGTACCAPDTTILEARSTLEHTELSYLVMTVNKSIANRTETHTSSHILDNCRCMVSHQCACVQHSFFEKSRI